MNIGIDIRPLQTGHKYRGIGEVTKQVTNRLVQELAASDETNKVIFYEYDDDDPKELLVIPENLEYEVIKQGPSPEKYKKATKWERVKRNLKNLYGNPVIGSHKSDVFLQFDYNFGVPKNTKTLLVKHDIIPYVFWDQYFESAWVPFKNKAARTTLRTIFANYKYKHVLSQSLKNATKIAAVSNSTKNDIIKYFGVKKKKVQVVHLGVSQEPAKTNDVIKTTNMPTKPYLLFVGAGDARRRVDDLVAAYNNLKADGRDIQLVLIGENFQAPTKIPNLITRQAVLRSSYSSDILTLGYVDDETKQRLYKDAIAYVYPTLYEGFGIPALESMIFECPLITYKNSSIPEVVGDCALFAHDWLDIKKRTIELMDMKPADRTAFIKAAKKHASEFTWDKTAHQVYNLVVGLK